MGSTGCRDDSVLAAARYSPAMTDPRADYAAFTAALIENHRAIGGQVTFGPFQGRPVVLLTTTGAKSGQPRTAPLVYSLDGDTIVIMASKGGAPENPSWYANLVANPEVTVEAAGATYQARAVPVMGEERRRLWDAHVAQNPGFAEYATRTTREIPVIRLERMA